MVKVCLDSNVLVSGLAYGGLPGKIVDLVLAKHIRLATSEFILDEVERNLRKCGQDRWTASFLRRRLTDLAEFYTPKGQLKIKGISPADALVVETASLAKARYLVTGDQELLALKHYKYSRIIQPRHFMKAWNASPPLD